MGGQDFGRLAIKKTFDPVAANQDVKFRNICTSTAVAKAFHFDKRCYSHIRAQTLKDMSCDPSPAAHNVVAGPSTRPATAQDAVAGPSTRPDTVRMDSDAGPSTRPDTVRMDSDEVEFIYEPTVENIHSTSLQAAQAPLACKVCNKPYFLVSELKRHEKCHLTAISADQWDSESLNSSTDEEEREARRDLDDALGPDSIVNRSIDDEDENAPRQPKHKGIGKSSKR